MVCVKCKCEVPDGLYCCQCGASQTPKKRNPRRRGNGTGSIIKRGRTYTAITPGDTYVVEDEQGKRHLKRTRVWKGGFATKAAANEYLAKLEESKGKVPTLHALWESYKKNSLPKLSASKQTAYHIAHDKLEPIMGRPIDQLTLSDLQEIIDTKGLTYYPSKDIKSVLSHLYKLAMPDRYVAINLSDFLVLPELEEKDAVPFNADEIQAFWSAWAAGDIFVGYILLMIYTGMMPIELMSCKKDMINWETCEIYGCGRKTKKRKEVPIVFPDFVRPVLEELCEKSTSRIGNVLSMNKDRFYKTYHNTLKSLGVRDLPPYSCRHTTATDAARQNISAATLQQLMRHAKLTTTQKYIHLSSEDARRAVNQMTKPDKKDVQPNC